MLNNTMNSGGAGRTAPGPIHPVTMIREAILNQRAAGVFVRIGAPLGVHCARQEPPCWERDPREKGGVSPFGATLLEHPYAPPIDPHEALAVLFDAPVAFVDGMADGLDKAEPDHARAGTGDARAYIGAWEIGYRLREELLRGGFSS